MSILPEVVQEKLGWQQHDINTLQEDMRQVKEEVHSLKSDVSRIEQKMESQSKASKIAHDKLSKDIAEIKSWVIGGVKAILGAIMTIAVALLIRYLV